MPHLADLPAFDWGRHEPRPAGAGAGKGEGEAAGGGGRECATRSDLSTMINHNTLNVPVPDALHDAVVLYRRTITFTYIVSTNQSPRLRIPRGRLAVVGAGRRRRRGRRRRGGGGGGSGGGDRRRGGDGAAAVLFFNKIIKID